MATFNKSRSLSQEKVRHLWNILECSEPMCHDDCDDDDGILVRSSNTAAVSKCFVYVTALAEI